MKVFNGLTMPLLINLSLANNDIGNEGVRWLARSMLPNLKALWLGIDLLIN